MLSAVIPPERSQPAVPLARQPAYQRFVHPVLSYYGQASSGFQRAQRIETKLSHDVLNPARVPL